MKKIKTRVRYSLFSLGFTSTLLLLPGCSFHTKETTLTHNAQHFEGPLGQHEASAPVKESFFEADKEDAFNHDLFLAQDSFKHEIADKPFRHKPTRPAQDFQVSNTVEIAKIHQEEIIQPLATLEEEPIPQISLPTTTNYSVKKGDSLWVIARKNGISLAKLLDANPQVTRKSVLKVGQTLNIPQSVSQDNEALALDKDAGSYTIQKGDTLSEIAMRFGITVDQLKRANNMLNNNIVAGKKLSIPGVDQQTIAAKTQKTPVVAKTTATTPALKTGDYQIQSGDSLSVIANRFGVTVADLMTWNNISDARKIRAGQWLNIHNASKKSAVLASASNPKNEFEALLPQLDEKEAEAFADDEFDPFDDDSLFSTTDEIPLVSAAS